MAGQVSTTMTGISRRAGGLQRRMVGTLAMVLLILSLIFLVVLSGLYRTRITAEQERAAIQLSALFHATLENAMLKRDLPGLAAIISALGHEPDISAVRVLNPELEVRFASPPALASEVLDTEQIRRALADRIPSAKALPDQPDILRAIRPVPNRAACQSCHGPVEEHPVNGILVIDFAKGELQAESRKTAVVLAFAGLAVTLASLAASWWVLRRTVINPVARIEAGTRALAAGHLDHRLPVTGQDEIATLSTGFNRMAARLQEAMGRLDAAGQTLQSVIDAIPDGIRVIGPDYRVLMANAAYVAQSGLSHAGVIGQPCYKLSHQRSSPCPDTLVICPVAEAANGRLPLNCRQIHKAPGGEERHVELAAATLVLVREGGSTACVVEAIRDLDQQARLSQEQRLSEIGLLAAGLAHEIHNPLSSISLLVDAAQSDLGAGDNPGAAGRLRMIGEEMRRTLTLTNSLMLLSMPPSEEPILVEIDRIVPEALAILSFQARQAGAKEVVDIQPGLRFLGSESDLRMLVTNLVLNAFHAMLDGGTVHITARSDGRDVVLVIADEGIGIAPSDLTRIFLPFWTRRADGTSGRGLGLAIVQSIITRWNGSVAVESTLGQGTVFTIRFPDPDARQEEGSR